MTTTPRFARPIAWCAFALGVAASVAANVAHAKPELGARLASAFAPVALLLTVEIMSRVPWPAGTWWKIGRFAGTGAVALVAAFTSYSHMVGLLRSYGETPFIAAIQPACVDGLMVVASLALLALGHTNNSVVTDETANQADHQPTQPAPTSQPVIPDRQPITAVTQAPAPTSTPVQPTQVEVPSGLVMSANMVAASHHKNTGTHITVDTLAGQLGVDHTTAHRLLTGINGGSDTAPARINGHNPAQVAH